MTILRKSSLLITGAAGLSFLDKARKAKLNPDSGTSLRSCQQQQYPTCTREKAVTLLKEMRAQTRGEKKGLAPVELEQLEDDVRGMEWESRIIDGVELFADSVSPAKFHESDDGSEKDFDENEVNEMMKRFNLAKMEGGYYAVNDTRTVMLQMAQEPEGESAGSGAVATGEQQPGQEEICAAEKHPYKCMMLGVKSGCAWSYHPDCGPQVGSCVAWQRGKQGGVDAEFESCSAWKKFQEEGGKTGACPGNEEDKNILVEKMYCGNGVPKDLLAAEKTVEEESKGKPAPSCKEGDVRVAEGSPNRPDVQMYGEVLMKDKWYPICGHYFWDSNDGASLFCKRMGYNQGVNKKTHVKMESDSVAVGKCDRKAKAVDGCSSGGNDFTNLDTNNGWCKKGNKIGVAINCKGQKGEGKRRNSCGNFLDCYNGNGMTDCYKERCKPLTDKNREEKINPSRNCGWNGKHFIQRRINDGAIFGCGYVFAETKGKSCDEWCGEQKMHCLRGQIAKDGCALNPDKSLNSQSNGDVRHGCEIKGAERSMCQCGLLGATGHIPGLDGPTGSAPAGL